jgi:hypothetical protein
MMWGIRATRVGFLLAGLIAAVAATGCQCDCCKKLWGTKSTPASQPTGQASAIDDKDAEKVLTDWKRGAQSYPGYPNEPKGHLTPERIHGGIY